MIRNTILPGLILLAGLALSGCANQESGSETVETGTIAPATVPSTDTEAQLPTTQTTEIGEDRSPNEGGILNEEDPSAPGPSPAPSP